MSESDSYRSKLELLEYGDLVKFEDTMIKEGLLKLKKNSKKTKVAIFNRIINYINVNIIPHGKTINIPEPSGSQQNIIRIPKVKFYKSKTDASDLYLEAIKFFNKNKKNMQVGDILEPIDGYRGDGTVLVDEKRNEDTGKIELILRYPIMFQNGEIMLPPWVFEKGMANGFRMEQLKEAYRSADSVSLGVYPYALQNFQDEPPILKFSKSKGIITSLRIFTMSFNPNNNYGEDIILDKKNYYYKDLNSPLLMSELFPNVAT